MQRILTRFVTVLFVISANLTLILPLDLISLEIKELLKDNKVVDALYWATRDNKVIDSILNASLIQDVSAEAPPPNGFYIQTGNFIGNAAPKKISGLGFSPDLVILKPDTTAGAGAIFKTKAMAVLNVPYFIATAQTTTGAIQLEEDGFTATTTTSNNLNVSTTWIAFGGSDCSASGVFCVGHYTGNGAGTRAITTGFQPDAVWVKRSTNVGGSWKTSSMGTNVSQFFAGVAQDATGVYFTTLDATGFTVGSTNNVNTGIYYYVAFKNVTGALNVGSYTGNVTDNRNITGVGFQPDFVFLKNSATTSVGVMNTTASYGDNSNLFSDTANLVNSIQALQSDGFQVGSDASSNGSGNTIYWVAFGGAADLSGGSGTFKAATGSYVGTGQHEVITGLDFMPDLITIKGNQAVAGVFRTSVMSGNTTAYLDQSTANFTGGIISINTDGFTIGTNSTVNTSGVTYYWTAYGNAWKSETNSGAADFFVGAFYGNGIDNRNITRLPFQPDLVSVKRSGATGGTWRISDHVGDISSVYAAAETGNNIQALNADGFQVGTTANVNSAANLYWYFGFKEGTNFTVGTYSGTGSTQDITTVGFQPDTLWVKSTAATRGVTRNSDAVGSLALPFINVASVANALTGFVANGFTVVSAAETNTAGSNNYRYAAWKNNYTPQSTPAYEMQTGYYIGNGAYKSITGIGFSPDLVMLKSNTTATATIFKTKFMAGPNVAYTIATADNTAGMIRLDQDGFTVSSTGNTSNARYTWMAFVGSDCSGSGQFCTTAHIGNGTSPRAITDVGFQPDLVFVKQSTAVAGAWRSSSMGTNVAQFFTNVVQDATGANFTTLDANGFTVGATLNASAGIYYDVAFKNATGEINVGTYTGNATDNRNITGIGFESDFLFLKNANATVSATYAVTESYGDSASLFTATANLVNSIQALQSDGFQVGSDSTSNGSGNTIYWAAFGGAAANSSGSGTFTMATGSYTGTGNYQIIEGLDFRPDLVMIKGNTAQAGIFRTRSMAADSSAYLDSATANVAGAINSMNVDGFTVGTSATVNTSGVTYYWTAYGNAWNPDTNSGAADFFIGAYYGNGIDNRSITRLPYEPDMLTVKRSGATGGAWRSTENTGDQSNFFAATAQTTNVIQAFNADGFQVGTAANVNTAANTYWYFGFVEGTNFDVGTYSGTGSAQDITTPGFQPDNIWVKSTGATRGVVKTSDLAGSNSIPFINVAAIANAITGIVANGFSVGTAGETNSAGSNNYRYAVWRVPEVGILYVDIVDSGGTPVASPTMAFSTIDTSFECTESTATFGVTNEKIRITNDSANPEWNLTISADGGAISLWEDGGTEDYDFNDNTGSPVGCADGGDSDGVAGRMTFSFANVTITPEGGCSATGITLGSDGGFTEGATDSVTIASAGGSADVGCYWDITGIEVYQAIPSDQASGTYSLPMSLTIVPI